MRDDGIDASALHALGEDDAAPRTDVAVFAAPVAPAPSVETVAAASIDAPPLFSQSKVRKPEYWQFAKLIAPSATLPPGKRAWTTDDAVGIWCLRCQRAFPYQKGSSQSIRYHMETKHLKELTEAQERSTTARVRSLQLRYAWCRCSVGLLCCVRMRRLEVGQCELPTPHRRRAQVAPLAPSEELP